MTLEEARLAAEAGNTDAMNALGNYYYKQKQYYEACEWYDRSAEKDNPYGIVMSIQLNTILALTLESLNRWESAFSHWKAVSENFLTLTSREDQFSEQDLSDAQENYKKSIYGMGYNLFRMELFEDAMKLLKHELHSNPGCILLYGLCLSHTEDGLKGAYPYLKILESDVPEVKEDLIFQGFMLLAIAYRKATLLDIPGITVDVERAYHCVLQAAALPGNLGEAAKKEAMRYHKKLLGGYSYEE